MKRIVVLALALAPLAAAADTVPPAILASPAQPPEPGQPVVIEAKIIDDSEIFEPTVYWREAGGSSFEPVSMAGQAPLFRAEFLPPEGSEAIEYFIEAYDAEGNGPSRYGAPQLPLLLQLPARPAVASQPDRTAPREKAPAEVAQAKEAREVKKAGTEPPAEVRPLTPVSEPVEPLPASPARWRKPVALGLLAAGVLLAGGGAASTLIARRDASTFNERFHSEGRFNAQEHASITSLATTGGALLGGSLLSMTAGGTLLLVEF